VSEQAKTEAERLARRLDLLARRYEDKDDAAAAAELRRLQSEVERLTLALTPERWTMAHNAAWDGGGNRCMSFRRLLELKG
jgi:hypothetical protein